MNNSKLGFARNLLCLAALIATISLGWLAGHVLRYSIPTLWHLPIEEIDPRIKTGYEFELEGIRPLAALPESSPVPQVRVYFGGLQVNLLERCVGSTYYTSLPAKCRSVEGRLVRIGESPWEIIP